MFIEPAPTNYDLRFQIFGFPVRVHPLFFLIPLLLGNSVISSAPNAGVAIIVVVLVFFVSILVHELGHAFFIRYFGNPCHIVLYWLGGLAITGSEFGSWSGGRGRSVAPRSQILISLAGPIFGLALAAILLAALYGLGGRVRVVYDGVIPLLVPSLRGTVFEGNDAIWLFFLVGMWANIFWNVLNLLPVYPLDGGQVVRQIMIISDPWDGVKKSLIVSIVAAVLMVIFSISRQETFLGMMFAFLGFSAYQQLTQVGGRGRW